jgi:hypothetical protein
VGEAPLFRLRLAFWAHWDKLMMTLFVSTSAIYPLSLKPLHEFFYLKLRTVTENMYSIRVEKTLLCAGVSFED